MVSIGDVTTWDTGCDLERQSKKVMEEAVKAEKKFICTGLEEVDVTLRPREDGLVMVHKETLVDIYQQGWYDGMSDTVAEPVFFNVYKMEAEDEHA